MNFYCVILFQAFYQEKENNFDTQLRDRFNLMKLLNLLVEIINHLQEVWISRHAFDVIF